jgi:hypothetical protein
MNVFYLDEDPRAAAHMHCDKHVYKMILEYAQLMMAAWYKEAEKDPMIVQYIVDNEFWKPSHLHHPATKWVQTGIIPYAWVFSCWEELLLIYAGKTGKFHAAMKYHDSLMLCPPSISEQMQWVEPPLCMPDSYKYGSAVDAYRRYYCIEKAGFAKWVGRQTPAWFSGPTSAVH